jgi:hypothetical protein
MIFISTDKESPRDENKQGSEMDEQEEAPTEVEHKTDDINEEIEDETEPATKVSDILLLVYCCLARFTETNKCFIFR